jgi:hypothetical protein
VRIWEPAAGRISAFMRTDSPLKDCAWSPSGQLLAVAGEAGLYLFTFKSRVPRAGEEPVAPVRGEAADQRTG